MKDFFISHIKKYNRMTITKTMDCCLGERQTGQLESRDRPMYHGYLIYKKKWYYVRKWGQRYPSQQIVLKLLHIHSRCLKAQKLILDPNHKCESSNYSVSIRR